MTRWVKYCTELSCLYMGLALEQHLFYLGVCVGEQEGIIASASHEENFSSDRG